MLCLQTCAFEPQSFCSWLRPLWFSLQYRFIWSIVPGREHGSALTSDSHHHKGLVFLRRTSFLDIYICTVFFECKAEGKTCRGQDVCSDFISLMRLKLTVGVIAAAVFWRKDEGAGSGNRDCTSLREEWDGGSSRQAEHRSRCVGPPEAGGQRRRRGVTEGASGHGDRQPRGVQLGVAFGGNFFTSCNPARTQVTLQLFLRWGGAGRDVGRGAGRDAWRSSCTTALWGAERSPGWRQVDRDVADVDGKDDSRLRRLQRYLWGRGRVGSLRTQHLPEMCRLVLCLSIF